MDHDRFERLTRTVSQVLSRRGLVSALGLTAAALPGLTVAKNKNPHLKKNNFGCVNVGNACRGKDANCCSGMCDGKKPKKGKRDKSKCVAHNVLDCPPEAAACQGLPVLCGTNGVCNQTTGQASFCAAGGNCKSCQKDVDCEPTHGPGAACAVCAGCPAPGTVCLSAAV